MTTAERIALVIVIGAGVGAVVTWRQHEAYRDAVERGAAEDRPFPAGTSLGNMLTQLELLAGSVEERLGLGTPAAAATSGGAAAAPAPVAPLFANPYPGSLAK